MKDKDKIGKSEMILDQQLSCRSREIAGEYSELISREYTDCKFELIDRAISQAQIELAEEKDRRAFWWFGLSGAAVATLALVLFLSGDAGRRVEQPQEIAMTGELARETTSATADVDSLTGLGLENSEEGFVLALADFSGELTDLIAEESLLEDNSEYLNLVNSSLGVGNEYQPLIIDSEEQRLDQEVQYYEVEYGEEYET